VCRPLPSERVMAAEAVAEDGADVVEGTGEVGVVVEETGVDVEGVGVGGEEETEADEEVGVDGTRLLLV